MVLGDEELYRLIRFSGVMSTRLNPSVPTQKTSRVLCKAIGVTIPRLLKELLKL